MRNLQEVRVGNIASKGAVELDRVTGETGFRRQCTMCTLDSSIPLWPNILWMEIECSPLAGTEETVPNVPEEVHATNKRVVKCHI